MSAPRQGGYPRLVLVAGFGAAAALALLAVHYSLFAAAPASAPSIEFHYAPAENLEQIDVALIGEAGDTLDIAAYVLTDVAVIAALTEAAARGVVVRLYRFPAERPETGAVREALAALTAEPTVTQKFKRDGELMHLKSYCVDGRLLRTGAANFSASGEKRQDNDLIIVRGDGVCAKFAADFAAMWEGE
jgi:phosphatidylserine/phosphatidylglycerophosphate/cardiolipin synthase-like enzyme